MPYLLDNLLLFGRILRRGGIDVHQGRLMDVAEALGYVHLASRDQVYHTCRALLVHRREQLGVFDRAFEAFWLGGRESEVGGVGRPDEPRVSEGVIEVILALDDPSVAGGDPPGNVPAPERGLKIWSDRGGLAGKDLGALTPEEIVEARKALSRLVWSPGERRTRRWILGRGTRIDLRRAVADSLRSGGDIVTLPTRTRRVRPR